MDKLIQKIKQLKEEKKAVILAHYYVPDEVQAVADYIGDSFYLSKRATSIDADVIVFCGVQFMGESAKILNPKKTVLMPDITADCPMAHMANIEDIKRLKEEYDDLSVVCYINSTTELKMHSDVCVTSSNALKIVKKLPNKNIFFIPDENLGRFVAEKIPEKNIILNKGYCHVHTNITKEAILTAKEIHKDAKFLAHPECKKEVLELADYIGSTSEIIDFACKDSSNEYIVGTELGVMYALKETNPDKNFYPADESLLCSNMKKITLEKLANVLETGQNEVLVDEEVARASLKPLEKMLELAK